MGVGADTLTFPDMRALIVRQCLIRRGAVGSAQDPAA